MISFVCKNVMQCVAFSYLEQSYAVANYIVLMSAIPCRIVVQLTLMQIIMEFICQTRSEYSRSCHRSFEHNWMKVLSMGITYLRTGYEYIGFSEVHCGVAQHAFTCDKPVLK